MEQAPPVWIRRRVAGVCCLAALVFLASGTARAGIATSRHDFVAGPNPPTAWQTEGSCSVCHIPHAADSLTVRWSRPLTEERSFYTQSPQSGASPPNYLPGMTVGCLDCHEASTGGADADPTGWAGGHEPQDISGYYRTACGENPGPGVPAPTDGSPTGGHYWKSDPDGASARGDKIKCSLCHDPHNNATGANEVFFRTTVWDGSQMKPLNDFNSYGTNLKASANTREGTGNGRAMCAICHGYSDQGNQAILYGVTVPDPPGGVTEHGSGSGVACTDCHNHDKVAGCNECHGYPPMLTEAEGDGTFNPNDPTKPLRKYVENYPGGAGAHRRHKDALGAAIFKCELCHGPNPGEPVQRPSTGASWHNQTSGDNCGTVDQINVDIVGMTAYWGAGSGYNGDTTGDFTEAGTAYAFAAKGGPDAPALSGRCANLSCHGNPPATGGTVFLNWDDKMVSDSTGDYVGDGYYICKWCHDATPARIDPLNHPERWAPNAFGDGTTWGAEVNGHSLASGNYEKESVGESPRIGNPAANKQCTVCHEVRYSTAALPAVNTPVKAHFDGLNDEARLKGSGGTKINGRDVADADGACLACHQNEGADDGAQVSTHGNTFTGKREADFSRSCRQCHEVHGANWNGTSRNLRMIGKWVDSQTVGTPGLAEAGEEARVDSNATTSAAAITTDDLKVIFSATSGENSFNDGFNDSQNPPESVCVVCHADLVLPYAEVTDVTTLRGAGHNVGANCRACHDHGFTPTVTITDAQAFKPSGCNGCHGTSANIAEVPPGTEGSEWFRGQFWPDGLAVNTDYTYADNQTGAHLRHIEAMSQQLYGETAATMVASVQSADKQRTICAFCHPDPGGGGHSTNDAAAPSGASRVNVFGGTGADLDPGTPVLLDWLRKYTPNAGPVPLYADDTTAGSGYNYTTQSCATLACHNQAATPAAPTGWNAPPVWTTLINTRCSQIACHAPGTYTLSHTQHVDAATRFFECTECHANNGVNLGHGNGEVDMLFTNVGALEAGIGAGNGFYDKDVSGGTAPTGGDTAFAYKTGSFAATCIQIYCHGDDNAAGQLPAADRGTDTTPVWNDSTTADCGKCHGTTAASPVGSAAHGTHAGSAAGQYAIGCQVCHNGTTADGTSIATQSIHVNSSVEVSFGSDARVQTATSAYGGDTVIGSGYGACTNTYCHSKGTDRVPPFNDAASVPAGPALAWDGSAGCGSCHGDGATGALPLYADGTLVDGAAKASKHDRHVTDSGYGCQVCHWPTTHNNGTSVFAAASHVNGSYDVDDDGAAPALDQLTYTAGTPGTCSANCHGDNVAVPGGVSWGLAGPIACEVCHARSAGASAAADANSFAWDGAAQSKIADVATTGEYDASGHGKTAAPKACADCHEGWNNVSNTGFDHDRAMNGTNPYRLKAAFTCSNTAAGCHESGPASTVMTHSNEVIGADAKRTWPSWDPQCVNCHDPHGDGNLAMIQRELYDKAPFHVNGSAATPPPDPTEQVTLAFTDDVTGASTAGTSYVDLNADFSSLCQECHEDASMVSFHDGAAGTGVGGTASGSGHPAPAGNPGKCTTCHPHPRGFGPSSCESCHGNPPNPGLTGSPNDDAPNVMGFYTVNGHGAKTFDPDGAGSEATRAVACKDCHDTGSPSPTTHLTGAVDTYVYPGSPYGGPNSNTSHLNGSYFGTASTAKDYQLNFDNNCNKNPNCHKDPPTIGHKPMLTHGMTNSDGAVLFGAHGTVADPKQARTPPYWTPWTIRDITIDAVDTPLKHYGPCVSCHDPHGADYSGYTYCLSAPDGNYHMVKKNFCDAVYFCNSNCHNP